MQFRIIHIDNDAHGASDLQEMIAVTSDMEIEASDFCPPGFNVVSDTVYEGSLASGFPDERAWRSE